MTLQIVTWTGIVQILGPVGGAAGVTALFLAPAQRSRIKASTTKEETSAAAELSGVALEMVTASRAEAHEAKADAADARRRASEAEARARTAEAHADAIDERCAALEERYAAELLRTRDLEQVLRAAGIAVPPRRRHGETDEGSSTR